MALPVLLREVVDGLDTTNDSIRAYINRKTGEVVPVSHDDAELAESNEPLDDLPQWHRETVEEVRRVLDDHDFILLPSQFEIHEWSIMDRFAQSQPDEEDREELLYAIHGRGAFRQFKRALDRLRLRDEWYQFRNAALEDIAIEFLESKGIAYRRR
jgi:hypothetical protein